MNERKTDKVDSGYKASANFSIAEKYVNIHFHFEKVPKGIKKISPNPFVSIQSPSLEKRGRGDLISNSHYGNLIKIN